MQNITLLKHIASGIQKLLGTHCEVVIHDFTDLEQSIVHIEGNVTGRSVRGAATDLILSQVRQGATDRDVYNYQTQLPNGHVIKSCTIYLNDADGQTFGAFCINLDITPFISFQSALGEILTTETQDISETFSDNIQSTIHSVLRETIREIGADAPIISREGKLDLVARLDEKGIFQVKRSVPVLAKELGLSRSTLYNYLNETRGDEQDGQGEDD